MKSVSELVELWDRLRKICPMGSTVYTYEDKHRGHVFLIVPTTENGKPALAAITGMACTATDRGWCLKCGGMVKTDGPDAVYCLSAALYPHSGPIELSARNASHGVDGREPDCGWMLKHVRL